MKLLLLFFIGFYSLLSSNDEFMVSIQKGLGEEQITYCTGLVEKLQKQKDIMMNTSGENFYFNYVSVKNSATNMGYDLPDLTLKQSRAIEARNHFIDYVNSYVAMSNECFYTNIGMLMITNKEQNNNLHKDLITQLSFIKDISTTLYDTQGIDKDTYESHMDLVKTLETIYNKYKQ